MKPKRFLEPKFFSVVKFKKLGFSAPLTLSNIRIKMCSGLDVNKSVNLWINLISLGTFHFCVIFEILNLLNWILIY